MHIPSSHICLHFLACLFSCLWISTGNAQELLFSNLSSEVQLPSQECYKVHQDKKGYIWFSTDNGLCKYGNNKLVVFDAKNGLPEESVYTISEDRSGTLWFTTSDNRILYYDGIGLKTAPFNQQYHKFFPQWENPIPYSMDVYEHGKFYVSTHFHSVSIATKTKKVRGIELNYPKSNFVFYKKKNHPFIQQPRKPVSSPKVQLTLVTETVKKTISFSVERNFYSHPQMITHLSGSTDFISIQNKLIKVNPDLSYSMYDFPGRILNLYTDKSGGLWIGTLNHGVFYYPDIRTMKQGHHSLRNYSVTGICEDNEQGIWCSTLEKGIFYCRSKHIVSYSAISGLDVNISLLKFYNRELYISSSSKELFVHSIAGFQQIPLFNERNARFSDLIYHRGKWFLTGKEAILVTDKQFKSQKRLLHTDYGLMASYELAATKEGRLFSVMYSTVFELFENHQSTLVTSNLPFISKTIIYKSGNTFLLGGNQGVYLFDSETLHYKKLQGIPDNVTKMRRTRDGRIWVITKNNGIYWIDGKQVTHADKILSLKPAVFFDITEAPDGRIFAGSNEGIYCFEKEGKTYKTTLYNTSNGLSSNEVYKIEADNESLWFSTFEGLFRFPLKVRLNNRTNPLINIQKLAVNGRTKPKIEHYLKLNHQQNNLRFTFDILTFKTGSKTTLKYVLSSGKKMTSTFLEGNEVILENLAPGNYQLNVYGMNNDGILSSSPVVFRIEIATPFWATWWFVLLSVFLLILIGSLIIRRIIQRIRKSEEAKTQINKRIAEYQITALQAQMNPHFIFNAINTIQGYILEKNEEEAYNYLAKFSKLIRTVLHHSQEKVLLLKYEIELLNLYIELEKLRFDNCFDYELLLSPETDVNEIHLPGMILQPYIENAIWHGIMNLKGKRRGKLTISINTTNALLTVRIKDNGVGRETAMAFNDNKRHKSVGMQLTGERLKAMNRLNGYETAQVIITDLFDEAGKPAGTCVEVNIPITVEP